MIDKVISSAAEAVKEIPDGVTLVVGGSAGRARRNRQGLALTF